MRIRCSFRLFSKRHELLHVMKSSCKFASACTHQECSSEVLAYSLPEAVLQEHVLPPKDTCKRLCSFQVVVIPSIASVISLMVCLAVQGALPCSLKLLLWEGLQSGHYNSDQVQIFSNQLLFFKLEVMEAPLHLFWTILG